jgi:hypothetical protein
MQFIEMTGSDLYHVISPDELHPDELRGAGVTEESLVRVNLQGDIEIRKAGGWEVVGGLLGDFAHRVKTQTGLDWA